MTAEMKSEPTLKDIARRAQVSVAAVSKVLNNRPGVSSATREHVLKVIEESGYRGRSGRAGALAPVSLLTLEQYVTHDSFYGEILSGMNLLAARAGLDLQLQVFHRVEEMSRPGALDGLDGPALLVGVDQPNIIDAVVARNVPAVIVNGMDRSMRLSSVSPDYHFGAWQATRHLLDLGHREIIHVTHPWRESIRRRIDGFRNALEEEGIAFHPDRHLIDLGAPENISIAARSIVAKVLKDRKPRPTAVFCLNDMVALGVIQAAQSQGLSVPEDLSVMGFDGLAVGSYSTPPLSSMLSDRTALARIAVDLLSARLADPAVPVQRVTTSVALGLRRSTAPPAG
ncbi:LacI family DNA-binding transcriptional regulator [Pseudooceanicola algae]|uniref:Catabolite control protein A n=1 Tax=Pseudooceanicola algae TaxID=1537215 RepID=A0A418SHC1_9RHOB|nr:LacI family DNA-binding transcriptional regulator [Pseudooceanicola algae]QPM90447.1 Catabolite control protein A [Pseudooceanicola algae]